MKAASVAKQKLIENIPEYPMMLLMVRTKRRPSIPETPKAENKMEYTSGPLPIPNWAMVRAGSIEVREPSHMKVVQDTSMKAHLL